MDVSQQQLEYHISDEQKQLDDLKNQLEKIRDNHLVHLAADVQGVKDDVSEVKTTVAIIQTDTGWIKKIGTILVSVLTASFIVILGVFIKLFVK